MPGYPLCRKIGPQYILDISLLRPLNQINIIFWLYCRWNTYVSAARNHGLAITSQKKQNPSPCAVLERASSIERYKIFYKTLTTTKMLDVRLEKLRVWQCLFGSPDMMGHPELVTEMEKEELGPLISTEGLEQLQNKYVQSVRVSLPQKVFVCLLLQFWPTGMETEFKRCSSYILKHFFFNENNVSFCTSSVNVNVKCSPTCGGHLWDPCCHTEGSNHVLPL